MLKQKRPMILILLLVAALVFAACKKEQTVAEKPADTPAAAEVEPPEIDEVDIRVETPSPAPVQTEEPSPEPGTEAPTEKPVVAVLTPFPEMSETPHPVETPTEEPTPEPEPDDEPAPEGPTEEEPLEELSPDELLSLEDPEPSTSATTRPTARPASPDALTDGDYLVRIYRDQTKENGTVWLSIGLLHYMELTEDAVSALKKGSTVQLTGYSFTIKSMERIDDEDYHEIWFNDDTEHCIYVPETGMWQFMNEDDEPYTYEDGSCRMPLATDAVLTDEYTPITEGKNIYGDPYDEEDSSIGELASLADFFRHHAKLPYETAQITVENGEIIGVLIEYHS